MIPTFYFASLVALISTIMAVTQFNAVRALLYLIVSLLAVAVIFFILGAPFAAALEVITYAGAIMVLFVFVIMILNLGPTSTREERLLFTRGIWLGPTALAALLLAELCYALWRAEGIKNASLSIVGPEKVGTSLLGPYAIGGELASMLLLSGLVGAYHLGYRAITETEKKKEDAASPVNKRLGGSTQGAAPT